MAMQVCDYCCTFIDPAGYATIISPPKPSPGSIKELSGLDIAAVDEVGEDEPEETSEQLATKDAFRKELHAINSLQSAHKFRSLEEKNKMAVEAIAVNLEKNQKMADFVEVKFNTENEIMQSLGTLSPM